MIFKLKYFFSAFCLFLLTSATAVYSLEVPQLKGRVNDYAGIISEQTKQELEAKLRDLEITDSTQVVVLTIPSLEGDSLEEFSIRVADKWKIGQSKKDNGAILLVVLNDRKMRIEVGYGLEGKLTDLISGRIIANVIRPSFKTGNFDTGITQGIDAIIATVKGEYKGDGSLYSGTKRESNRLLSLLIFALIFVTIAGSIKKILGGAAGAIILPILGLLLFPLGIWLLILIPVGFALGLILPVIFGSFGGGPGIFYGGHGHGGFGGGGFSGGGFGGGGGGFGGGGSSGSW